MLFYTGRGGVQQDLAQAAAWVRKAAEQGSATAQKNLGAFLMLGQGVPQDNSEAYFWLAVAVTGLTGTEQEGVAKTRDAIAAKLTPAELSAARNRATSWLAAHPRQR